MVMLSIIVPVFNKELYVEECIKSILDQSFTAFELILVNDGSTDQSGERCRHYAKLDARIIVIEQENKGVSAARNAGLNCAKGQYIGFVDSDDTIEQDMYAILMKNALTVGADISVCRLQLIKENHFSKLAEPHYVKVLNHQQALLSSLKGDLDHNVNNKIYRVQILHGLRFEGVIYEDILFVCKAFLNSAQTVVENVAKYNYMIRTNSVSMSSFNVNYLETVAISAQIVDLVALNDQECLAEAMAFDVMANISLLNLLLLLPDKRSYMLEYSKVVLRLQKYNEFIKKSKEVRAKHKYAWQLFSISPVIYCYCMRTYCLIMGSDAIKRTQ